MPVMGLAASRVAGVRVGVALAAALRFGEETEASSARVVRETAPTARRIPEAFPDGGSPHRSTGGIRTPQSLSSPGVGLSTGHRPFGRRGPPVRCLRNLGIPAPVVRFQNRTESVHGLGDRDDSKQRACRRVAHSPRRSPEHGQGTEMGSMTGKRGPTGAIHPCSRKVANGRDPECGRQMQDAGVRTKMSRNP